MAETYNFGALYIHAWEWAALPIYLAVIFLVSHILQRRRIRDNPLYRFYLWGLFAKIGGGIIFSLIYLYYYKGGDTISYFESALAMKNLLWESPPAWLLNEFGANSVQHYSLFTGATGYPLPYMYYDLHTIAAIRVICLLVIPAFNSYLLATVIIAWVGYWGIWRMFLVFAAIYPKLKNSLAFAILFFPSVLFWSSGILKDTITLSCTGWAIYCIYSVFILKRSQISYSLLLLLNVYLILLIKPYIVIALLPGCLIWIFSERINSIRNTLVKVLLLSTIIIICTVSGYFVFSQLNSYLGKFSLQKIAQTAEVIQKDLHQSYYHGHGFDIGAVGNTATSFFTKSPQALAVGLFRPYIWETGNVVMLFSGLENTLILVLLLLMILRNRVKILLQRFIAEPLLFFSITYSAFFAYAVGISTSNFGALVRFKVAYLPFFVASILILLQAKSRIRIEKD